MIRALVSVLLVCNVGALQAQQAEQQPQYKVLLVGVSEYPHIGAENQLKGPKNDVTLFADMLVKRGVPKADMKVLADGVADAELPTRLNILRTLEQMAASAKPNDYVVVYMAGHGSQVPSALSGPMAAGETDGLVEVFLPRDVRQWENKGKGNDGEIPNAISKYELRQSVQRMTDKGAFVWTVFDACHSATLVRSASSEASTPRQVTASALGVPSASTRLGTGGGATKAKTSEPKADGLPPASKLPRDVHFYAAQTTQITDERPLPTGSPEAKDYGVFTYNLVRAIERSAGPLNYNQLAQQILVQYAGAGNSATPAFTGTGLNSGVLGVPPSPYQQWGLTVAAGDQGLRVQAGQFAEVYAGSVFAILPNAGAKTEQALGYARVTQASATSAALDPVAFEGKTKASLAQLKEGRIARLVAPGMNFTLRVAADLTACGKPCAFASPLNSLKGVVNKEGSSSSNIQWVEPQQGADMVLRAEGQQLWFLPTSFAGQALPQFPEKRFRTLNASESDLSGAIASNLATVSRAFNLIRIASTLNDPRGKYLPNWEFKRQTNHALSQGTVKVGDEMKVQVKNTQPHGIDLNVLYVDSKFNITTLHPTCGGDNRLARGASLPMKLSWDSSTLGLEQMIVVTVPEVADQMALNLSYLDAKCHKGSEPTTRSASTDELFSNAGLSTMTTRSRSAVASTKDLSVGVMTWTVLP